MVKKWQISLAIAMMLLGILLSMQFKTRQNIVNDLKQQKTEDLQTTAANINSKNLDLVRQQADLKSQLENLRKNENEGQTLYQSFVSDMDKMNIVLGTAPVKGSGIRITLDVNVIPDSLPLIVNDLWNSGAEAIAVNGIRVNNNTQFSKDKYDLPTINGNNIETPLIIEAIGPPDNMATSVAIPGRELDTYKTQFKTPADIKQVDQLSLPATDK